jgi:small subunit ribosomal protein S15
LYRFGQHALDVGNAGVQAAISCERVISMLDHIRKNHKDVAALIKLQRLLVRRRKMLMYLKREDGLKYRQVLRVYSMEDVETVKGESIHKQSMHCQSRR